MPDDAARLTARTRADNTGLTQGMQEADRIVRQGAQQMQRTATIGGVNIGSALRSGISPHLTQLRHDTALLQRTADQAGGVWGALTFTGLAVGAIKAVDAVADLTAELYDAGAAAQRMHEGFRDLAGDDRAVGMLDQLREAARGTISDMGLIASANRAMMLQVTQDADTMARLVEVAIARGRNLGVGAQEAFDNIATGIGRMSHLVLDNLGILTGGQQGMERYAKTIGKTADQLTDFEKRQYLVNKVLEDSVTLTDDAASSMERYAAARENLKTEVGLVMAEALPDIPGAKADIAQSQADQMRRHREAADAMIAYKDQLIAMQEAGMLADTQLGMMTQTWITLSQEVDHGRLNYEQAKMAMLAMFPELHASLEEWAQAQAAATAQTELASGAALRKEQADMRAASAAWDRAAAERGLAAAIAAGYGAGMDPWLVRRAQDPRAGAGVSVQEQIREDKEALREREQANEAAARKAESAASSAASKAQREAEQRAREYRSLVESVLQPTQVTGADVSATEHGVYQEKWDEEMRRLRARKDVPYYQVAETERQFYSGQLLDQVNWDAVIADMARRQQEVAGRENLINEAIRRTQAAGIAANYADVAAALGIRDDTVLGMEAAEAFETGAKGIDVAAGITEQFIAQIKAQRAAYVEAGTEAMRAFLEGSDQAITPDAGKSFARRIVPFIYDEMQAQGML